jgi:hypothetical protein
MEGTSAALSSVDVSPIVNQITAMLPIAVPALISVLAIRKGVSFLIGLIKGA